MLPSFIGMPISHEIRIPEPIPISAHDGSMGLFCIFISELIAQNINPFMDQYIYESQSGKWNVSQQNPVYLLYLGDYITHIYRHYNKPLLKIHNNQPLSWNAIRVLNVASLEVACEVPLSSVSTMLSAALLQHLGVLGNRGVVEHRDGMTVVS